MDSRSDIEATLYAMVHHSVSSLAGNQMNLAQFAQQPIQLRPNLQPVNMYQNTNTFDHNLSRNMVESRYWRQQTSTNSIFEFNNSRHGFNQRSVMGFNSRMTIEPNIPSGNRPRIFNSYTPYLSYSNNNNNGQNNVRTFPNNQQHPNRGRGNFNNRNNMRGNNRNNQNNKRNNPNLNKEQRMGKYAAKKQRVETIKNKFELNKQNNIVLPSINDFASKIVPKETVVLSSEEEKDEDDDEAVILVAIPSPPMVCIDDSDNENETSIFATPNLPSCSGLQKTKAVRPCSPTSSVVSDDFIILNDRSRVNTESINITEDDELQCRQPTVGSLLHNSSSNLDTNEEDLLTEKLQAADLLKSNDNSFVTPKTVTSYQVVDTSIRETDVYESAESSDIPESVYDRLAIKNINSNSNNQNDSIESDNIAPAINETRIKKLCKRKSSGSNKGSEYASSNDEQEEESLPIINRDKTSTPYIVRGSAVDSFAKDGKLQTSRTKNKQKRQKFNSINQSDDDFISTLSNICGSENEKDDTPPEITAKDLIANTARSNDQRKENSQKTITLESTPMEQDVDHNNSMLKTSNDENIVTIDDDDNLNRDNFVETVKDNNLNKSSSKKRKKISLVDDSDDDEIGWNTEMRNFYNESWGGENFNLADVQSKMKGSPSLWRIRNEDKFPIERYGKSNKIRCLNCSEIGHIRARCTQPRKKPICRMCGSQNHKEPRCTNKICLKCGSPNIVFSAACNQCRFQTNSRCGICKQKGHNSQFCPDTWRRYHSTTSDHTPLQDKVEYSKEKYCPTCGGKGHWAESCNSAMRFLDVPAPTSRIISHTPVYPINKNAVKNDSQNKKLLKASVLKEPPSDVNIKLQKYVSFDKKTFYGRFLNAIEKQANEKKLNKQMQIKKNMLLNPFSKISKPITNIVNFSFSEEMEKLNTTQNKTNPTFKLDFITPKNKPIENLPTTSISGLNDKSIIVIAEEKSDSNYSFSEFYEKGEEPNTEPQKNITAVMEKPNLITEEIPKKVGRNDHMVERDYISLSINDDENMKEKPSSSAQCDVVLSETIATPDAEQNCTAKIYLTKPDSQLLLSSSGQDIISSLCSKYKVVVKMEWQSKGNVLNITGLPSEQNLFHTDFVKHIQESRKDQKRKQLEQSLQVPKHKKPLIKYIDNLFSMLKINLGDVNQVYRKMTYNEKLNSRNGQKMADRSRRVLNMILFGQMGLREGNEHLEALKNISGYLKSEGEDAPITNEFRNELFRHVKYIFTPFEHPDYNGAIKDYYDIKYISIEEVNKEEQHLKPNPLAIVNNVVEEPCFSTSKVANILPQHIVASDKWSLKCKELVEQCRTLLENDESNAKLISKLDRVYDKALKRELNYCDHQALMKIISKIQAKAKMLN